MNAQILFLALVIGTVVALALYMRAQKPTTEAQRLIQQHRYAEAVLAASNDPLHRAEAQKLLGEFEQAVTSYRASDDPAAAEGIALALAHAGHDLEESRRLMEETITRYPQIQEFQALSLAYILLRAGSRDQALRLFRDNLELLETRFRDDYTDPDPLLAETLWMFARLSEESGDANAAQLLRQRAASWAPGSVWARG